MKPKQQLKKNTEQQIKIKKGMHKWQKSCQKALDEYRFLVAVVHRQGGKTHFAILILVSRAVNAKTKLPRFVYFAPQAKQAKRILWKRLKKEFSDQFNIAEYTVTETELTITFHENDACVQLLGADEPDTIRGVTLDGAVLDEVAQMKREIWDEIVQPALILRNGWSLFIGTSKGVNLFYELYLKAESRENQAVWHSKKFTVYETNTIPKQEVARLKREMDPATFAREYLCDFSIAGDSQLIAISDCNIAMNRMYNFTDYYKTPCVFGVDVARYGSDSSVISIRQNVKLLKYFKYNRLSNTELANEIEKLAKEYLPEYILIDAGGGAGVIDTLRENGVDAVEVFFAGRADNPALYYNKRAEMYFRIKYWIELKGQIPEDSELVKELSIPRYFYNLQHKRQIEKKEEIKSRMRNSSPDIADALALTFFFDESFIETKEDKKNSEDERQRFLGRFTKYRKK